MHFGMSALELEQVAGKPTVVSTNRKGEKNHQYDGWSVRYSKELEKVVEFGFTPRTEVIYQDISVFKDVDAFQKIISLDGDAFEYVGFIVLLKLGITLTGFHDGDESQKAITAFAQGRWDHLKEKFRQFPSYGKAEKIVATTGRRDANQKQK